MTKPKVDAVHTLGQQMSVVRKEYKNLVARKPDANKPSFTIQMLADRLGIEPRVVQRALAETLDLARKFDIPTLMQTASALGVSLTYAAVIAVRDCLVKKAEEPVLGDGPEMRDRRISRRRGLLSICDELTRAAVWMNPFRSAMTGTRLAMRALRLEERRDGREDGARLPTSVLAYEHKLNFPSQSEVDQWAEKIVRGGARKLRRKAARMKEVHAMRDTLATVAAWPAAGSSPWPGNRAQELLSWYCPPGAGTIDLSWSPTLFGAIGVEVLSAEVFDAPAIIDDATRTHVRCINARHTGYEFAVVSEGAVRLTVSGSPFEHEHNEDTPRFEEGSGGVILDRIVRAGEVIGFRSDRFHRCEFLARRTQVISFNISRSALIHNKLNLPVDLEQVAPVAAQARRQKLR
ncbi:MAG TPA: hypothetical protein VIX73_27405 [Kofleriaceae bacterium]|jgi:hypothetical protein